MLNKVNIPQPCTENIDDMRPCESGRHCAVCKKDLLDLRKKDLASVNTIMQKNPGACIVVHERHTTTGNKWIYAFINRFEAFLHRYKMAALASVLVPAFLFVSGCQSRKKPPHKVGKFKQEMPSEKKAEQF